MQIVNYTVPVTLYSSSQILTSYSASSKVQHFPISGVQMHRISYTFVKLFIYKYLRTRVLKIPMIDRKFLPILRRSSGSRFVRANGRSIYFSENKFVPPISRSYQPTQTKLLSRTYIHMFICWSESLLICGFPSIGVVLERGYNADLVEKAQTHSLKIL